MRLGVSFGCINAWTAGINTRMMGIHTGSARASLSPGLRTFRDTLPSSELEAYSERDFRFSYTDWKREHSLASLFRRHARNDLETETPYRRQTLGA